MRLAPRFRTIQTLLFNSQPSLITNSFFSSSHLKPRIQMLVNPKTKRQLLWKYALVMPLLALLVVLTAARERIIETLANQPGDTITVSGRVVDSKGEPVPKATVLIAGGTRGTPTDDNGRFIISDVPVTAKLAVSSVGFDSQLLTLQRTSNIVVKLKHRREELPTMGATANYKAVGINKAMPVSADPPASQTANSEVFTVVEQNPVFPDGIPGLMYYVAHNLRYPVQARKAKVQGKVFVKFVVTATGKVDRIRVIKGIGKGCDEEAVRVVSRMPNWTPGKQYGKPVNVEYILPLEFAFEEQIDKRTGEAGIKERAVKDRDSQPQLATISRSTLENDGPAVTIMAGKSTDVPLVVIDGKKQPDNLDLTTIKSSGVDSVHYDVDKSAQAAYGGKGESGVIFIYTKAKKP